MQVEKIDPTWMRFNRNTFTISDRDKIPDGSRLNDRHINYAQNIIKCQFSIKGLQSTLLQSTSRLPISELQIVHSKGNHCIVASTILTKPNSVDVYDSLYNSIDPESLKIFVVLKKFVWLKYRNKKAVMTVDCLPLYMQYI